MKQSILITGGLGYIGSITTVELYKTLPKNIQIVIIDNLSNSSIDVIQRIQQSIDKQATEPQFAFHQVDLLDLISLDKLFEDYDKIAPIRYILHFAALKAVGESVANPIKYFKNNVQGTFNLFECMQKYKCPNFLFSSSATVYAPGNYVDEEAPYCPSNPYGETKVTIDYLLRSYAKSTTGRFVSLRYFNPVGGSKDMLLGELPIQPNNLFPYIEQVAIGKKESLNVFGSDYDTPDGTGVRDYIHVLDLANGHAIVIQHMIQKDIANENWYDYFNLGTGKGYSVLEVVQAYQLHNNTTIKHQIVGRRAGDVPILVANPQKAFKVLGWQAIYGLEDMCKDSYNFIRNNQN